jgi:hypothetical protein
VRFPNDTAQRTHLTHGLIKPESLVFSPRQKISSFRIEMPTKLLTSTGEAVASRKGFGNLFVNPFPQNFRRQEPI